MFERAPSRVFVAALSVAVAAAAGVGACSSDSQFADDQASSGSSGKSSSGHGGSGVGGSGVGTGFADSSGAGIGGNGQTFDVQPSALQTITVAPGSTTPTVKYKATSNGQPVDVTWSVDRGDVGTISTKPASSAAFAPTGTAGGLVDVLATRNGKTLQRQVFIQLQAPLQNGANANNPAEQPQISTDPASLSQGGGIGGVGGEGLGPAVSNFPTTNAGSLQGLAFLYPYDKTVWPRGMLAPLLMWTSQLGDADAIQIDLATSSGSFKWSGQFGRPPLLGGNPFVRHPIPQDVWDMATNTAGGQTPNGMPDQLTVSLTIAKGGMLYGPVSETWIVAPGRLAGTVYYNSYGTHLVQNSIEPSYNNGPQFGAAVLGIKGGATGPSVVAGTPSPEGTGTGCRVCHVVSADGSRLVAQHGDNYARTSTYDLKNNNAETSLDAYDNTFGWAGLYPDGSMVLTNTADLAASGPASQLYAFPPTSNQPLAANGIPSDLQAGAPAFSPDGKHVSFEFLGGTIGSTTGDGTQLVALDFDKATMSFTNLRPLATPMSTGGQRAGFPSFFPTNDAVVFHYQIVNSNHRYNTWNGAKAQIWWSDLGTGTATNLYALNGLDSTGMNSYLPTGQNNHGDDTVVNYEPTMSPVATGGYAWVIFTSRRLYGNLATQDPWLSDPRSYDATQYSNITCKKLWVAAVDIGSIVNGKFMEGDAPGTDPSHPAFYLPGQELLAGNARGFWVLDPCKQDGMSCMTGDQCCSGFCEPDMNGDLVCNPMTSGCSGLQEKCTTSADCCDPDAICVNGFCAQETPK